MKGIAATTTEDGRCDFFWLDLNFAMCTCSPVRGGGFNLNFGGTFASVPAAAATMARRPIVANPDLAHAEAAVVRPIGGLPLSHRLDLFGLGLDYAMYHKRFWGAFDENDDQVPWQKLGGDFIAAPAAIAWVDERIDVFSVGTDHAMYQKTAIGNGAWTAEWQRLGGAFTSAASLTVVGKQLNLFARGADFTLRGNQCDGTSWSGFQNHGGNLASPPVAVSWGPKRIDIFAIFNDGALWHRWWDGEIWNDWESLGGKYTGEPAAAAWAPGRLDVFVVGADDRKLHHYWFAGDTWSVPETLAIDSDEGIESPTVASLAPNKLQVFVPTLGGSIRIGAWNGSTWNFGSAGADLRTPGRYRMSVDVVVVRRPRAFISDTDGAVASVLAGNAAVQTKTQWIGDIGIPKIPLNISTGIQSAQTNLLYFVPVTVDPAEPMSFSYLVVNNGSAEQAKILAALASGSNSLALAGSSSMQGDIAKGITQIVTVTLGGLVKVTIPVLGSVLAAIETWLLGKLAAVVFAKCDGVVAAEMRAMMGRELWALTDNGQNPLAVTTRHHGTRSPAGCGANSIYDVVWTIYPL